ncbi:probable lipid-A-disaccharide synthase, mitochondrial isoform X1 [Benincasa hispida]|uniref:probable lipid-A-disaccharide synthase, mitochondrial isoform X1 n=1 Tax=Benincasa hispida TaxID=102211 RepID=UPI001901ED49|nr:probable lipid-A-disaccharide synthase, mitochondrial isoform X1 [Benincasa hispida]
MSWIYWKCCLERRPVMQGLLNNTKRYLSNYQVAANAFEMAAKHGELRVFIVAGEVSGDTIGSRLMSSLRTLSPVPVHFSGIGGPMMSKQGLESLFPMEDIAVMGIWELFPHLRRIREKLKRTVEAAIVFQPHVVVTVDSKGFSFRLLKQIRARYRCRKLDGPLHFHYVAPSFWAWKGGEERLKGLVEFVDHILCILPNEEEVCKSNGLAATFVGHPILEDTLELNVGKDASSIELKIQGSCKDFLIKNDISDDATTISLLPGSRLQEVSRMIPIYTSTLELLKESFPELITIIHVAPNQHVQDYISGVLHNWPVPAILVAGGSPRAKYDAFSASKVALCTSGTVVTELQLARLPCVVAYRAHFLTEWFIRRKANVSYISLPNILLNSPVIPEALFQECTPARLHSMLKELILNDDLRNKQVIAAKEVLKLLSPSKENMKILAQEGLKCTSSICIPSMIAASAILFYKRTQEVGWNQPVFQQ